MHTHFVYIFCSVIIFILIIFIKILNITEHEVSNKFCALLFISSRCTSNDEDNNNDDNKNNNSNNKNIQTPIVRHSHFVEEGGGRIKKGEGIPHEMEDQTCGDKFLCANVPTHLSFPPLNIKIACHV